MTKQKQTVFILLFIFILLLTSTSIKAIGVSPPSFSEQDYDALKTYDYTLSVHNNEGHPHYAKLGVEGDLIKSFTCDECDSENRFFLETDEWKHIHVHVKFKPYDELSSFGQTTFKFRVAEIPDPRFVQGMFAITTTVLVRAHINVPIPGLYVDAISVSSANINKGFNNTLTIKLKNKGVLDANGVTTKAIVTDINGNKVLEKNYPPKDVLVGETVTIQDDNLETDKLESGLYHVNVYATYDPDKKPSHAETKFFIGGADILLTNYTQELVRGKINKVDFNFQSIYPLPVNRVQASFPLEGENMPLPSLNFGPFGATKTNIYIDVPKNQTLGDLNTTMTIDYIFDGQEETRTTPLHFEVVKPKPVAKAETKTTKSMKIYITSMIIFVVLIILLLLFLLLKDKKKKTKETTKSDSEEIRKPKKPQAKQQKENQKKETKDKKNDSKNNSQENEFDWTK